MTRFRLRMGRWRSVPTYPWTNSRTRWRIGFAGRGTWGKMRDCGVKRFRKGRLPSLGTRVCSIRMDPAFTRRANECRPAGLLAVAERSRAGLSHSEDIQEIDFSGLKTMAHSYLS